MTRGNGREKPRGVAWTETGIATVWIGNVADRAIVSEGLGADRVNADAGEVAINCRISISKRSNAVAEEIVTKANAIGIARGDGRQARIVSGTSGTSCREFCFYEMCVCVYIS